jgi:multidrug efflux system membrane fusion protein
VDLDRQETMKSRKWLLGVVVLAMAGAVFFARGYFTGAPGPVRAQGGGGERVIPVEIGKVERKKVPVNLDALGSVTPIASVALKSRSETTIMAVHFRDGAHVEKGELLFTLDCRQIEADMKRVQAVIDGAQASLEQAQRDVSRYTDLVDRNATPIVTLNNAQTAVNVSRATAESNRAQLENLRVQLGYCSIRAPIAGRISMANVKVGNFVRPADTAPMASIIQTAPIYVSFPVPQRNLPAIREAIAAETATVQASIPGDSKHAEGAVTMIENTVDAATGTAMIRATMPNKDELLWPGTLVNARMTLRVEDAVTVPSNAVSISQTGNFVFLVEDGKAKVQPIVVERQAGDVSIIASGLTGGETVVTDGQAFLSNGTRVRVQGAGRPASGGKPAGS